MNETNVDKDLLYLEKVQKLLINYQLDLNVRKLQQIFYKKSITDIYGVARKELQHSQFIAWLLNPYESHGFGSFALERLLLLVVKRGMQQNNNDSLFLAIKNDLLVTHLNTGNISVKTEYKVNGGRIDILVGNLQLGDKTTNIVIENKVDSKEHDCQTETYYKEINKNFPDDYNIFIFLTPKSSKVLDRLNASSCDCKAFIEISYQDILINILESMLKEEMASQTRVILEDYIHSITTPSNNSTHQSIMAMNKYTQELLIKFWESNEELIRSALEALAWNQEDDNANKVLELLNKRDRDYSKYLLSGEKKSVNKRNLALSIAKRISKMDNPVEVLNTIDNECGQQGINFLSKRKDNKRYDSIDIEVVDENGNREIKSFKINNQWTKDKIGKLIEVVKSNTDLEIDIDNDKR